MQVRRERLAAAWNVYERVYLPALAVRTHRGYRAAARRFLAELPESFGLSDLVLWRGRMVEQSRLSAVYVNQAIKVVRGITRRASHVTGDTELASLFAQLETLRAPIKTPRCPPADYVARVVGACRNPGEKAFVLLSALAGLRTSEILGLRSEDWDGPQRVLKVIRQRHRGLRKNGRPHAVIVNTPVLARAIDWTIEHRDELVPWQGPRGARSSDGFLFPWTHTYVEGLIQRMRAHLGADAARYMPRGTALYAGRHWGATELARVTGSAYDVQSWLGDADPSMATSYVAMTRGMTSTSVGVLADRWRAHARRAAHQSKVAQCTAARPCTGRRRHGADGTSPPKGPPRPEGTPGKGSHCHEAHPRKPSGRED